MTVEATLGIILMFVAFIAQFVWAVRNNTFDNE